MSEPNIEEIVAELEALIPASDHWVGADKNHMRTLCASWRERGEALEKSLEQVEALAPSSVQMAISPEFNKGFLQGLTHAAKLIRDARAARAALKDKP